MSGSWLLIRRRIGNALLWAAHENRVGLILIALAYYSMTRVVLVSIILHHLRCPFIPISSGSVILTVLAVVQCEGHLHPEI